MLNKTPETHLMEQDIRYFKARAGEFDTAAAKTPSPVVAQRLAKWADWYRKRAEILVQVKEVYTSQGD